MAAYKSKLQILQLNKRISGRLGRLVNLSYATAVNFFISLILWNYIVCSDIAPKYSTTTSRNSKAAREIYRLLCHNKAISRTNS